MDNSLFTSADGIKFSLEHVPNLSIFFQNLQELQYIMAFHHQKRFYIDDTLQVFSFPATVSYFEVKNVGTEGKIFIYLRDSAISFNSKPEVLEKNQSCPIDIDTDEFKYKASKESIIEVVGEFK